MVRSGHAADHGIAGHMDPTLPQITIEEPSKPSYVSGVTGSQARCGHDTMHIGTNMTMGDHKGTVVSHRADDSLGTPLAVGNCWLHSILPNQTTTSPPADPGWRCE